MTDWIHLQVKKEFIETKDNETIHVYVTSEGERLLPAKYVVVLANVLIDNIERDHNEEFRELMEDARAEIGQLE